MPNLDPPLILNSTKLILKNRLLYIGVILSASLLVNFSIRLDYYLLAGIPELSITETLQSLMLVVTAYCFYQVFRCTVFRPAGALFLGFFIVLLIRESDYWFDFVRHGFWVYPALIATLYTCCYFLLYGKAAFAQLAQLLSIPHMSKVLIGVILLITFSRLFGTGSFWQQVLQQDYHSVVKNIVQEGLELLCYCLITIGSFETQRYVKHSQPAMV